MERRCIGISGGMQTGPDGNLHTNFGHNPSSLRLCSFDPNLQNLPRISGGEIDAYVKEIFVAPEGYRFWARDYAGIEAVLVGYFAGSSRYTRLARVGVHAFLASHLHHAPADLGWSDANLVGYFKEIKGRDKVIYDTAKRIVHGSNYQMTPRKMCYEYPEVFFNVKEASRLQGLYFDLFPEIKNWHRDLCLRVDGTKRRPEGGFERDEHLDSWSLGVCHARNPFGYVHRFYNVLDWERIEYEGKGEWIWSFGEDAKRLVSFLPQSTAAAILKRATKRIWYDYPWVGTTLRLLIHDEVFGLCKDDEVEECLSISQEVMEAPINELPLDPSWGMGEYLKIGSEGKAGKTWASMTEVK